MRIGFGQICIAGLAILQLFAVPPVVCAENDGQTDLDEATQLKVSIYTRSKLDKVIDLCQSALDKGLNQESEQFCKELLVATLVRRAQAVARIRDNPRGFLSYKPQSPSAEEWRAAVRDIERAIEIGPLESAARLMMARLQLLPQGDRENARQALDEAIRLAKDDAQTKLEALRLRAGLQADLEDGIKDLSAALELAPNDVELLRSRGESYLRRNKADLALADFDAAIPLAAYDFTLQLNRATALEALKRYHEARDCYTRLLEAMPDQAYFRFCRARVSSLAGDHLLVIEDANQLLESDPNQSFALTMRAYALTQLQRFPEALADAERAIALQPDSTYAIWLWASLVAKTGRSNSSIKLLRQQIEAKSDDSVAWLQLALLYCERRLLTKALDAYSVVIELGQHRAFAYQQRADIYLKTGMRKEAISDYEGSLKFDPNGSGALNNLAWALCTAPEAELRDGKRALELALKACDVTSYQQAHILSTLAAAHAECGDFASARKWSQKSVELADDSIKESCRRELASYEKEQPWREDMGGAEE